MKLIEIVKPVQEEEKYGIFTAISVKPHKQVQSAVKRISTEYPIPKYLKRIRRRTDAQDGLDILLGVHDVVDVTDELVRQEILTLFDESKITENVYGTPFLSVRIPNLEGMELSDFDQCPWPLRINASFFEKDSLSLVESQLANTSIEAAVQQLQRKCRGSTGSVCSKEGFIVALQDFPAIHLIGPGGDRPMTPLAHPLLISIERLLQDKKLAGGEQREHLCTDCSIIVESEPCLMCCMALVLSRVKYVIYLNNRRKGGFSSEFLHTKKEINHRIRVFQNLQ